MNAAQAPAPDQPWTRLDAPDQPAPPSLSPPSTGHSRFYAWARWGAILPAGLQPHRPSATTDRAYCADFTASPELREQWTQLFDLRQDRAGAPYPLLQAHGVGTLLQARVLADQGLHRRQLRHLRQHSRLPQGATAFAQAMHQRLECRLQRLVRVSPTDVLAQLQTRISVAGQTLAVVEDSYWVDGLKPTHAVRADEDELARRSFSRAQRRLPEIDPAGDGVLRRQLFVPGDAARRFGRLSGERSWSLRFPLTRRNPLPVQNLYLRSLVSRELAEWGVDQDSLEIHFVSPARLGQTLCLLVQGQQFELLGEPSSEGGLLVAFGKSV